MPEGHTIHRLARDQRKTLVGQPVVVTSPQGRFATGAQMLTGRRLDDIEACGKHLFYRFDGNSGPVLHIHLGLFGKYRTQQRFDPLPEPRGAVRVRFVSDTHVVDLAGPNQCEVLEPAQMQAVIDRLGPDPLRTDADPDRAWRRICKSRSTIGQLVMDQAVMSGVGNIYRTELLFRAKLCPATPGRCLTRSQFDAIWTDAVKLLNVGVRYNRIITVDLKSSERPASKLTYGERTLIFGKTHCPSCAGPVTRFEIAKRRAFRCARCQPSTSS